MSKTIAIDFDNVLNNLLSKWVEYLNLAYNLDKTVDDMKCWNMSDNYPELDDYQIYSALQDPLFWRDIELLPKVRSTLKDMLKQNYKVVIVTDSDYRTIKFKWTNCLLRLLGDIISSKDIIITSQKYLIKCDYIIDDYENNLKDSSAVRLLIDYLYNRNADENTFDYRCKDISEAWETILYIEEIKRVKEMKGNVFNTCESCYGI